MRTTRSADVVLQTYVIHNKAGLQRAESDVWWTYQSNVHGVVTAVNDLPKSSIHAYPKIRGAVIELFIPDILVTAADFEEADYLDITQFLGRSKVILLDALEYGFFCLMEYYRSIQQRQDLRYAGRSYGTISVALMQCREIIEDSDEHEVDENIWQLVNIPNTLKRYKSIHTPA